MQNRHIDIQFKSTLISAISFVDNVKVIGQIQPDRGNVNHEKLFIVGTTSPDENAVVVEVLSEAWLNDNTDFDLESYFELDENNHLIFK
ncbi:MAG TPA: hypothetical protein GX692_08410 [Acholeplasmataceae bacterium]|jgi:hypothetical protein|nr:hypothetical protein [Acholeplasmataceae bacterium]